MSLKEKILALEVDKAWARLKIHHLGVANPHDLATLLDHAIDNCRDLLQVGFANARGITKFVTDFSIMQNDIPRIADSFPELGLVMISVRHL